MPDETIDKPEQIAGSAAEAPETPVVESPAEQVSEDPFVMPEDMKARYKSVRDVEEFAKQKQSEADSYRQQVEGFQREQKPPETKSDLTNQELVDKFVGDPKGFFQEMMAPLQAQMALQEFARTHPDMESLRAEMASFVQKNPKLGYQVLSNPDGLEMVYNHVKAQQSAGKLQQAAQVTQAHREKVGQIKRTDAFTESSTAPGRQKSAVITPGMSTEEMDKNLDEAGVGWISDEERHKADIDE